jgi:hypothetical protein
MTEIRATYDPLEQAAAAFIAAAGQVDALLPRVDGPAGADSGDAAVNDGIARIASDLRGDLATAATTLRSTGQLLDAARLCYDDTDRSLMPALPTPARAQ